MPDPADLTIHDLLDRVDEAAEGDSNDAEIEAYREALEEALDLAGIDRDRTKPRRLPKVQIIHGRDPDSECGLTVYLDGQRVDAEVEDIDPGRGYSRSDWDQRLTEAEATVLANPGNGYYAQRLAELREFGSSKYITDPDD